jgi:hypothetical protein
MPFLSAGLKFLAETIIPIIIGAVVWLANRFKLSFDVMVKFVKNLVDFFKVTLPDAIKSFGDKFKNVFKGVGDFFKNIINGIIKGINSFISAVNKISIDIPDWVPEIGGKKFGFDFQEIPLLGENSTITRASAAVIGRAGVGTNNLAAGTAVNALNNGAVININNPKFFDANDVSKMMNPVVDRLRLKGLITA